MGGRVDPNEEALVWCRKCSELYAVPSGTETFEPLQAGKERHGKIWKMLKIIFKLEEGRVPERNAEGWKVEGEKRVTGKECKRLREEFEVARPTRCVEYRQQEVVGRQGSDIQRGGILGQRIQGHARRKLSLQLAEGQGRRGKEWEKERLRAERKRVERPWPFWLKSTLSFFDLRHVVSRPKWL